MAEEKETKAKKSTAKKTAPKKTAAKKSAPKEAPEQSGEEGAELILDLVEKGRKNGGTLTDSELMDTLQCVPLTADQLDAMYILFSKQGIEIVDDSKSADDDGDDTSEEEELDLSVPEGVSIDDPVLTAEEKLAVILGTEGDGLAAKTIADCDYTVKIPMAHGVDSLNVAAAGAVAFWQLGKH